MMKKLVIFGIISIFLLSGCEQIKELYGIETTGEEEYIPIEEIMIEGDEDVIELPPMPPDEDIEEIIVGLEEDEKELEEEVEEILEEIDEEETIEEEAEEIIEIIEEAEGETTEFEEDAPKGDAKVLIVKETDLVSLNPKASDPDKDKLTFSYTTPLNKDGKWQTDYGDAGEYTITLTVSDGQLSATKDVLIIVNKREEAPVIEDSVPGESTLKVSENSEIEFSVKATDLNKDSLTYIWKLDGEEESTDKTYTYDIGYDDAGQHTVKIIVTDGVKEASKIWAVTVENVNRKPILKAISSIKVKENYLIVIEPEASDPDGDDLTFTIDSEAFTQTDGVFEWATTYDDDGEYSVTITVSDGEDEVSQTVKITVENVNRAPVIDDIILG